jgi:RNA polymerase sigma-70 factor (ECF subfamily)
MLERLYMKLEKPMFNVVYRWLWDAAEAQDVTQEAFLRVWNARDRVDVATVEPLLYRTALNLASNRRRSQRLWRWLGIDEARDAASGAPASDDALESARTRKRVQAAISALPERLRQVVVLSEFSELSYAQIGEALGIPAGTVGSRRNAALAALATALGGLES